MKRLTAKEAASRVKELSENHAKTIPLDDVFTKIDAAILDGALTIEFSFWKYKVDGAKLPEIAVSMIAMCVQSAGYDVSVNYITTDDGWKSSLNISWESQFEELFAEDGEDDGDSAESDE